MAKISLSKIPYIFGGYKQATLGTMNLQLVSHSTALIHFDQTTLQAFGSIYFDVLNAIAEQDNEYLSGVMEPNLYNYYQSSLDYLKSDEHGRDLSFGTNDIPNDVEDLAELDATKPPIFFAPDYGAMSKSIGLNIWENRSETLGLSMEARGVYGKDIIRSENTISKIFS